MRQCKDNEFDLAIVDPPYGIGISSNPVRQQHEKKNWDNAIPSKEYFDEIKRDRITVDVKGKDTPTSRLKRKLVEALYGITVEVVR